MSTGEWFKFKAFEGTLIDGRDFSLKEFFCLKGDVEGFKDVGE